MANYEQTMPFYPKDMGKQKGWCLQNCRLGFHIYTPKYASAKAAMDAAKRNGTYHAGTPPNNISVPVYVSSSSKYGHVVVWDKGTWWSDGKRYRSWSGVLGWDEMMDGTRVVKVSSGKGFLPAKGYWKVGDCDPRIGKLCNLQTPLNQSASWISKMGNSDSDRSISSIPFSLNTFGLCAIAGSDQRAEEIGVIGFLVSIT
jgi:hypothetical protein